MELIKFHIQYKVAGVITLSLSSLSAIAQAVRPQTVELDTLTKVIGIGLTIGGFFMGYMQMRMSNKIAEVEAKFNHALSETEKTFTTVLHKETSVLEDKIRISQKEIEAKMATRHDIDNVKTLSKMQHEITNLQMQGLKEQLKDALKKD